MGDIVHADSELKYFLKDIRKRNILTPERERELSKIVRGGNLTQVQLDKIQQELIEGNMRFVINVAKKYQGQGLSISDLIAEGNAGLVKAARNFDWEQNNRFITYAVWWIRQSIMQSLNDNSRTIRLPTNIIRDIHKSKKKFDTVIDDLGESDVLSAEENEAYINLPTTVNTEDVLTDDGMKILDTLTNENAEMPDKELETNAQVISKAKALLIVLDDRERFIVESYFGINGDAMTLEEIGQAVGDGLTKERVRQIKDKALRKLRSQAFDLFDYIDEN
jgi:RNA polymerase primary sigma factor